MIKSYSPEEKVGILKQHFVGKKSVPAVCKEYRITSEIFEKWKTVFFDSGDLVFRQMPQDGMDYFHNYDFVVNWLSEVFRGQTLSALGIDTGEIRRVCSYKPSEISVSTGVVDVIFEDVTGRAYHLEEQRSMTEDDLYRFASQYFSAAREWKDNITDILLISGRPYSGKRELRTLSGKYSPTFADLTERDGPGRLKDIREAADRGDLSALTELVFLPLYGRKTGREQAEFVKKVIRFEIGLHRQERIPAPLIAATLIMANKQIDKTDFQKLWEEIKMLDILKFAIEKGMEEGEEKGKKEGKKEGEKEGKKEGKKEGRIEAAREMVVEALWESVGIVPAYIAKQVMSVSMPDMLKELLRQAMRCKNIEDFEKMLELANRQSPA